MAFADRRLVLYRSRPGPGSKWPSRGTFYIPQLAVQYNSSGGNGWLGLGWDIPMQAVTIDTRWGVPRYSETQETETYLLNGQQLTPLAHRESLVSRSSEKIFHTRVEGAFQKIIRHGNAPTNYWWEVIDKNGTHYYYGGEPATHGPAADSTLVEGRGRIAKWALRLVQDSNGNTMRYECARQADTGFNLDGGVMGYELYLEKINYTGHVTHGDKNYPYEVVFTRDRQLGEPRRADVGIDARLGFKRVTADLLRRIEVKYKGQMVRSYELTYQKGAFEKTLLAAVIQYDSQGREFNRHAFDYFDEARNPSGRYIGFGPTETWNTGDDGVNGGLIDQDAGRASALGGTSSFGGGGHLYVGFNFYDRKKEGSVGGKIGLSRNSSQGLLTLTDINGDGLPDKVFGSGSRFRANKSGPGGDTVFDDPKEIGLGGISKETSDTFSTGFEAYFLSTIGANWSHTFTDSATYLSDVNGDGLTDLVQGGSVNFGRPEDASQTRPKPVYSQNSSQTPYPIGGGAVNAQELLEDFEEVYQQMLDASPLHDTLRRWVAPYDGRIRISGDAALVEDTSEDRGKYETADGVRVAIQHNGSELWAQTIEATDYSPQSPHGVASIRVDKGDRIYFRVQSVFDGAYDQVHWSPTIEYLNVQPVVDVNGRNPYRYQADQDFITAGRSSMFVALPTTGTIQLSGTVEKLGPTSDDVRVRVMRNDDQVWSYTLGFDQSGSVAVDQLLDVALEDRLKLYIEVDSPIDLALIRWQPHLEYTAIEGYDSAYDHEGNPVLAFDPPYVADVYGANDLSAPQAMWTAPQSGTPAVKAAITTAAEEGVLILTVKRLNELVAKGFLDVAQARQDDLPLEIVVHPVVAADDQLIFELSTRDRAFAEAIDDYDISLQYPGSINAITVPGGFHYPAEEGLFSQPFRGWTCAGYRGEGERAEQPIVEADLVLPEFDKDRYDRNGEATDPAELDPQTNPQSDTAIIFYPEPALNRWRGYDEGSWLTADVQSSSRVGSDFIGVPQSGQYAGARAVHRLSQNTQIGGMLGVLGASVSATGGNNRGLLDFIDMNGDRFPDVVSASRIQYSPMTGGLESESKAVETNIRAGESDANSFGLGGNFASSEVNGKGETEKSGMQMPSLGISGGFGDSTDSRDHDLIDINGDGLPDKVHDDGDAQSHRKVCVEF